MNCKLRCLTSFLCTALLHVPGVLCGSSCQNGWTGYDNNCYLFVTHMKTSWNEASQFCHTLNSRLAEIHNAREDNFLRQHLFDYGRHEDFWVGGTDVVIEGDWIWALSQTPVYHYTNWAHHVPDNAHGNENCMELKYTYHYTWNDDVCSDPEFFICEQP